MKLTKKQQRKLQKLWFEYGNNGRKSTMFNHKYIQGFLEYGEDRKEPYLDGIEELKKKGFEKDAITQECITEVEKIVYGNDE